MEVGNPGQYHAVESAPEWDRCSASTGTVGNALPGDVRAARDETRYERDDDQAKDRRAASNTAGAEGAVTRSSPVRGAAEYACAARSRA